MITDSKAVPVRGSSIEEEEEEEILLLGDVQIDDIKNRPPIFRV